MATGRQKTGGRKKGVPNKRTQAVMRPAVGAVATIRPPPPTLCVDPSIDHRATGSRWAAHGHPVPQEEAPRGAGQSSMWV